MTVLSRVCACPIVLTACITLLACSPMPPERTSDADDAALYADVVEAAAHALAHDSRIVLHPFLAVATDSTGAPRMNEIAFEYEPSAALAMLARQDTAVATCEPEHHGGCDGDYLILSQVARTGPRDAVVFVRAMDDARKPRQVVVRLRYSREGWLVTGAQASSR